MFKRFMPYAYAKSVFDVHIDFFVKEKVSTLLVDLDNTLDSYRAIEPSTRVKELKEKLDKASIELVIISNNKAQRVGNYASKLNVKFLNSTHKPFKKRLLAFLDKHQIDKNQCMLVGDQLVTDVQLGKNAGIKVLLCDKIVKEDQWTTHFNRLIDRPIRHHLKRKKKLTSWEEKLYGKEKN